MNFSFLPFFGTRSFAGTLKSRAETRSARQRLAKIIPIPVAYRVDALESGHGGISNFPQSTRSYVGPRPIRGVSRRGFRVTTAVMRETC